MIRKIKALCLTVFALAALGASAATALASEIHSEATHTVLEGTPHAAEDVWLFNAGAVTCPGTKYGGTINQATVTVFDLTPTFNLCKAFGFINTKFDHEGCVYRFSTEAGTENNEGNMSIVCPAGKVMRITAFNCEVTIPSQNGLKKVTYTSQNSGAPKERDITIDLNLTGITYTQHSKGVPGCVNATAVNGTLNGSTTMRGYNAVGTQVGVWNH